MRHLVERIKEISRHPFLLLGLGVSSCLLLLGQTMLSHQSLQRREERVLALKREALVQEERNAAQEKLLTQLKVADREYVERQLETQSFLKTECQKIEAILLANPDHYTLKERLNLLKTNNQLHFRMQDVKRKDKFQESLLIQEKAVEMNQEDLKSLLARIENVPISELQGNRPPDLWIKKLELHKHTLNKNEETFRVQLELIKRELTHE
jgi:hypothetical protein